jgi:hypothetical protein
MKGKDKTSAKHTDEDFLAEGRIGYATDAPRKI